MMKQQLLDKIKQSPWYISAEDIQKYSKIFDHFDQSKAGLINDEQMTSVFT